jgi:hypothetical protein
VILRNTTCYWNFYINSTTACMKFHYCSSLCFTVQYSIYCLYRVHRLAVDVQKGVIWVLTNWRTLTAVYREGIEGFVAQQRVHNLRYSPVLSWILTNLSELKSQCDVAVVILKSIDFSDWDEYSGLNGTAGRVYCDQFFGFYSVLIGRCHDNLKLNFFVANRIHYSKNFVLAL